MPPAPYYYIGYTYIVSRFCSCSTPPSIYMVQTRKSCVLLFPARNTINLKLSEYISYYFTPGPALLY